MFKKLFWLNYILIAFIVIGCASFATINTNKWIEYEILPSIVENNFVILRSKLSDGTEFIVVEDDEMNSSDAKYYYSLLMQDFGWHLEGDSWKGPILEVRRTEIGKLYVNPMRKIAIYFYPRGTYGVFRVIFESETN